MNSSLFMVLFTSFILLFGFIIFLYVYLTRIFNDGRVEAQNFLNQLKDTLYNRMIGVLKSFDYENYDNLNSIEVDIINKMYISANNYISEEIGRNKDKLSYYALKSLSKRFIEEHIDFIINNIDIFKSIEEELGPRFEQLQSEFIKEEESLKKQYSNESIYYINDRNIKLESTEKDLVDSDKDGLKLYGFVHPSKEEESLLNPQIEDEEKFNKDDESMEIILEDEESKDVYVDSLGRLRDKNTNKIKK